MLLRCIDPAERRAGQLQAPHADSSSLLRMDLLEGRAPYDYTFNFWNDYLGLSTLVANSKTSSPSCNPNSITESLKATLGLEDDAPVCSCVIGHGRDGDGHLECCCAAPGSPPISIYDLKERISLLRPYEHLAAGSPLADTDPASYRGGFAGLDLLSMDRRRKQTQRSKPEPKLCVFCRNNGAPEEVYGTHILKTADGRVLCPILRAYTCPLCSANGDNAHTIKYCPLSKDQASQRAAKGGRAPGKRLKIF
ncbi:nanos homolog 1 [Larimichthys crocea]|uniref:nanos homolog 1 n=1 Tax=Larimichthys crocea TaxID=215358 RepID=UPI000F604128|nr:nanos homolog 1 [Larimichthys crocea]